MRLPILNASQRRARGKAKVSAAAQLMPEVSAGPRRASARHLRTEPTFRAATGVRVAADVRTGSKLRAEPAFPAEPEVRTVRQHRAEAPFRAAPGADRVAMHTL